MEGDRHGSGDLAGPEAVLRTGRLLLRPWRESDLGPFAALNADPRVMEHFPKPLDRSESDAMVARIRAHFDRHGFGFWAVEASGISGIIGLVGLAIPAFEAHFTPCVEIGWRLAREHWGKGYASEAALASLRHGFEHLGLAEIVAFTAVGNVRSRAVMERIGMTRSGRDDFDHPALPEGHRLRRHVLYRIGRDALRATVRGSERTASVQDPGIFVPDDGDDRPR